MSQQIESAHSWEEARRIGSLIGDVPSSFSSVLRFIRQDADKGSTELGKYARFGLSRLLKSDSFVSPLFYAARVFCPDKVEDGSSLTRQKIGSLFTPKDLCVLIALSYLFRKIRAGCPAEEWVFIEELLNQHSFVGGMVGSAIPTIGLADGLLSGSIRMLSQAMFLGIDKVNYPKYRREMKRKGVLCDLETEQQIWQCTHAQIASILIQPFGFGIQASEQLLSGLSFGLENAQSLPKPVVAQRTLWLWIEALLKTGKQPDISHRVDLFPNKTDLDNLLASVTQFKSDPGQFVWISRGKADISPETTPSLFPAKVEKIAAPVEEVATEVVATVEDALKGLEEEIEE